MSLVTCHVSGVTCHILASFFTNKQLQLGVLRGTTKAGQGYKNTVNVPGISSGGGGAPPRIDNDDESYQPAEAQAAPTSPSGGRGGKQLPTPPGRGR